MPQKGQFSEADITPAAGQFSEADLAAPVGSTTSGAAAMPAGDNPKGLTAGQAAVLPKNQRIAYMRNANPSQFETQQQGTAQFNRTLGNAEMNVAATIGGLLLPGGSGVGPAVSRMVTGGAMTAAPGALEHAATGEEQHIGRDFSIGAAGAGLFELPALIGTTRRALTNWLSRRMDVSDELAAATLAKDEAVSSRVATLNKAVSKNQDLQTKRDLIAQEVQGERVSTLNKSVSKTRDIQTRRDLKVAEVNRVNEYNAQVADRSFQIAKQRDQIATGLVDDVSQVENSVRVQLDTGWNSLRQTMAGTQGNMQRVAGSVSKARKLVSSTNNLEFEGILSNARGDAVEPTWENLRAMYQNLGYTRAAGNMSPDVYTAVKSLQQDIGSELHAIAATKNADAQFTQLMEKWSQYLDDFKDASGPAGSPVAKALRYRDRTPFIRNLTGDAAIRTKEILQRWGGQHELINQYLQLGDEMATLPKFKAQSIPVEAGISPSDIPALPKEPGQPLMPASNIPTLKKVPSVPKTEALQAAKLAEKTAKAKKVVGYGAALAGASAVAGYTGRTIYKAGSTILSGE